MPERTPWGTTMRSFIVLGLLVAGGFAWSTGVCAQEDRTVVLAKSWDAFNGRKYEEAIKLAGTSVEQFSRQAARDQQRIQSGSARPLPPGPADPSSSTAKATFANGVLNETAACMFVLASSHERTAQCKEALEAYKVLSKLTHARAWDPRGWFWAPSDAALDSIERLKGKC